jgi:hypothetical protein
LKHIDPDPPASGNRVPRTRAIALAAAAAAGFFVLAGFIETTLIGILKPTQLTLDWISDVVLSSALFVAVYLWLHLRATRAALSIREREQVTMQAQLALAESMQRRLLPALPAPADGFEWAAVLKAAGSIGGDFFDFRDPQPGVRLMLMADVSGKGISAAMALTLLRAAFHNLARTTDRPAELASRMSDAFHDEWQGSPYVTAVVARVWTPNAGRSPTRMPAIRGDCCCGAASIGLSEKAILRSASCGTPPTSSRRSISRTAISVSS